MYTTQTLGKEEKISKAKALLHSTQNTIGVKTKQSHCFVKDNSGENLWLRSRFHQKKLSRNARFALNYRA
jgi:hypothetical protein